jgi:hypothetical protein
MWLVFTVISLRRAAVSRVYFVTWLRTIAIDEMLNVLERLFDLRQSSHNILAHYRTRCWSCQCLQNIFVQLHSVSKRANLMSSDHNEHFATFDDGCDHVDMNTCSWSCCYIAMHKLIKVFVITVKRFLVRHLHTERQRIIIRKQVYWKNSESVTINT